MKKTILYIFISIFITSCAPVLIGIGALGGYAIAPDELEGIYNVPQEELFNRSKEVLINWSTDVLEDENQTELIATTKKKRVWIKVERLNANITKLKVKARKYGFKDIKKINTYTMPDIKTAQEIFEQIVAPIYKK